VSAHPAAAELRAAAPLVAAGVLAGDLADIGGAARALEAGGARVLHVDVGDGVYSPLMLGGPGLVAAVSTPAYKDVHLMIDAPARHLRAFIAAGADMLTVQLDAGRHLVACLREIAAHPSARDPARPILRGLGLPLELPVEALEPFLGEVDLVLVLGVVPGFKSAAHPRLAERVAAVRALAGPLLVSVDGGVTATNAVELAGAGADLVVSGSALFAGGDPAGTLAALQQRLHTPGARHNGSSTPAAGSTAS
jgi:ribulose-phosphate 3-epimerase